MKKVKFMLMAIAVVAVTGGLVAAKVNRSSIFCTTTAPTSTTCPTSPSGTKITNGSLGTGSVACTAATVNDLCPTAASSYTTTLLSTD